MCVAPVLRFDSGSSRSMRSETAWLPRSRPLLAIRRPSATIRQDRSLRKLRSRHQRPYRASTAADSSLLSRPFAFTPLRTCAPHTSARTINDNRPGFAARLVSVRSNAARLNAATSRRTVRKCSVVRCNAGAAHQSAVMNARHHSGRSRIRSATKPVCWGVDP